MISSRLLGERTSFSGYAEGWVCPSVHSFIALHYISWVSRWGGGAGNMGWGIKRRRETGGHMKSETEREGHSVKIERNKEGEGERERESVGGLGFAQRPWLPSSSSSSSSSSLLHTFTLFPALYCNISLNWDATRVYSIKTKALHIPYCPIKQFKHHGKTI